MRPRMFNTAGKIRDGGLKMLKRETVNWASRLPIPEPTVNLRIRSGAETGPFERDSG